MKYIKRMLLLAIIIITLSLGCCTSAIHASATSSDQAKAEETKRFDIKQWIVMGIVFVASMTIMTTITYKKNQQEADQEHKNIK